MLIGLVQTAGRGGSHPTVVVAAAVAAAAAAVAAAIAAAAMAATPEAVFVSMIDNLDARMGMVQRSLRKAPENGILSDYLPGLKTKLLLTPPKKN